MLVEMVLTYIAEVKQYQYFLEQALYIVPMFRLKPSFTLEELLL